jgi:membrane fusion protein, multidrug efflux system
MRFNFHRLVPLALVATFASCTENEFQAPPAPVVAVASPTIEDVVEYVVLTGRTEALRVVEVPARVQGVLERIEYAPGDWVEEGQALFHIDEGPFVAARDAAQASVVSAEAQASLADTAAQRMEKSAGQGAISELQALESRAEALVAAAQVQVAEGQLKIKQLDLDYTQVTAPIQGRIMVSVPTVGTLVGVIGSGPLTTIYDDSKVYAWFTAPDRIFLEKLAKGANLGEQVYPSVEMATEIDRAFPHRGQIDYVDPAVDAQTGTVRVRAIFDNPERRLTDGLFVRVRIASEPIIGAVMVPETAIGQDQVGRYLYVVDETGTCTRRNVKLGPVGKGGRVVHEGVEAGDKVIVEGVLKARDGSKVTPIPAGAPSAAGEPGPKGA